ncbi:MAG: hypothetical protein V4726_13050 [Verrucomicrobiota bacterium]
MTVRHLCLVLGTCSLFSLSACKSQRTVLAGPVKTSLDVQDKTGDGGASGGSGFGSRFNSVDPFGYNENASNTDGKGGRGKGGLNAMSEKMFGGKLQAQSKKEYTATKNFLTREYGKEKEYKAKDWKGGKKDNPSNWTDQLFATGENKDGGMTFHEGSKEAATKENSAASKVAGTKEFAGADKQASGTKNYFPAEKARSGGRDEPKLANAQAGDHSSENDSILQRIKNSQATASDINKYLGKP